MPLGRPVERTPLPTPETEAATGVLGGIPIGEIVRVGGALTVVLGLLLVVRLIMRRGGGVAGGGRPSGVLEVLARYPLGKGHQLILIKLTRRVLLVHQGGGHVTTLSEIVDPDEVAALLSRVEAGSRGPAAAKFGSLLNRYQREHGAWPQSPGGPPATRADRPVPEVVDLTRLPSRVTSGLGRRGVIS